MPAKNYDELTRIERKRILLERLLAFARQLARLQGGVETLQQMLKPSQVPGRKSSAIASFCTQLSRHETPDLQQKLATLDRLIALELAGIIALSKLTQEEFIAQYASDTTDAVVALEARLIEFRRNGQVNVAIRYILHERGIQIEAARLPVTQEQVSERLAALRNEESRCRSRIRDEILEQMADLKLVLEDSRYPDNLKQQFAQSLAWLQQGLDVLERGGKLDELPFFIETVVMEDKKPLPPEPLDNAAKTEGPKTTPISATPPAKKPRKLGFRQRLRIWMNTPWDVKWKDIDGRGK